MRTLKALSIAATLGLAFLAVVSSRSASANWPGNLALQANYNDVLDGQVRMCNQSVNLPAADSTWSINQWNTAIGATIMADSCSSPVITITDVRDGDCGLAADGTSNAACAQYPYTDDRVSLYQHITDAVAGYTVAQRETVATHETGHNLGFDHTTGVSIMIPTPYAYTQPQALDISNYHTGYTVLPPSVGTPTSPGANQVQLTWNQSLIWNEATFPVYRKNGAGGYDWIASAGENTSGILLSGQPAGAQMYEVGGFTKADCFGFGGFCAASAPVSVTVLSPSVDLQPVSYSGSTSPGENASQTFSLTVKNNGTIASAGSYQAIKFNGSFAPNGQGACFIASVPPNGGTASCTTGSITMNFGGGPITVTADNSNNIGETNESNNVLSSGTLGVKPSAPTAVFVSPPFAAYGYTDHSAIENGFGVTMQRRAGGCGSTGWSSVPGFSPYLNGSLSGSNQAVTIAPWSPVTHGYCYRVTVTALGPYANSSAVTGADVNYP